ncbi:MAG: hypothetical protein JW874_08300 [Spirochaetales bacterium]|nr:hypothetical protein [Spirochaetales bacterium]
MRAAIIVEGQAVYRTEINALVFLLKSRGITVCDDTLSAEIVFTAYYHVHNNRILKNIVKQARINRNQIFVIFGFVLPYSGVHEECDTVFLIQPEIMDMLYRLPQYLADNIQNTSLYMLARNFFNDLPKSGLSADSQISHPVLYTVGKSRAILNILHSDSQGRTSPVPVEILLGQLREVETAVIKEVYLSGDRQNVWSYDGLNFNDLLEMLRKESRNVRFRLGSLSPVFFDAAFYRLAASPDICPFFSISVQMPGSGAEDLADPGVFSFDTLSKTITELHDCRDRPFVSLDYEYGNGGDLINELNRLYTFIQKWKIPSLYLYESESYANSRAKARTEKTAGEERVVLERRIRKAVADNLKSYVLSLKDLEVELILDTRYKDGWLGLLPNGLGGFVESEDFFHKQGSVYYGKVYGRYVDDMLFVEKIH